MGDKVDLDALGRFVERIFGRVGLHSRVWITVWLSAILVITAIAAIWRAPTGAYFILGLVAMVVIFADGRGEP